MKLSIATVFFLFISLYAFAQSNQIEDAKIQSVNKLFQKWDHLNSPGAAIGIVQNGKMLYSKGFGLANLEHSIPNTTHTAFDIASNSKQFTAACIVLLSQQGKLDLNQSLSSIFPDFPDYAKTIRINNLLHHTSGLRDYQQIAYLTGLRPNDFYNDEDIMKWTIRQQGLNFQPGEKYLYSNSGYWLLGQIVNKVSGMSLADFAKKELFEPLGMNNTHFYDNADMVIANKASGYNPIRSGGFRNLITTLEQVGDGGVYTTVEDIKKWDDEFYNQHILKDSFWEIMTTKGVLNNGEVLIYASGLELKDYKGLKTIAHGGRAPGFRSNIIRFPNQKFTVIVFSNSSSVFATSLGYQIADIFLEESLVKPPAKKTEKIKIGAVKPGIEKLKSYTGAYWNPTSMASRKVILKNDTLLFERNPGSIHPLLPIGTDTFKLLHTPPDIEASVVFSQEGDLNGLNVVINGSKGGRFHAYLPKVYTHKDLEAIVGMYYSEEIDTTYDFKLEKDQLWLFIKGRRIVPLRRVKDDFFTSPMCDFDFKMNNQKIEEFTVSTPRVKNLSFKSIK